MDKLKDNSISGTSINISYSSVVIGNDAEILNSPNNTDHGRAIQKQLKRRYINHYSSWTIPRIDSENGFVYKQEDRSSFMVELTVLNEQSSKIPPRAANELNRYLLQRRESSSLVDLPNILDSTLKCSVLLGVAGIGKSSTVEYLALSWARGEVYSERFDFVFLFSCRNFLRYQKKNMNIQTLFLNEFNIDYKSLDDVDGDKVLLILDGLDELDSLQSILSGDTSEDINNLLLEMINEKSSIFPGHNTLLVGRPHILSVLKKFEAFTGPFKNVQILGLTKESIHEYVRNFCCNNNDLQQRILEKIFQSVSVEAMARIPQFLTSICSVYAWETSDFSLERKSELFVWALLSFLKHQFSEFLLMTPHELLSKDVVKSCISALSKLSYKLLRENRVLFEEKEVKELEAKDPLLKRLLCAFIAIEVSDQISSYRFRHSIIQQFFAAVYCLGVDISVCKLINKELYEVAEFLAGFVRARKGKSRGVVSLFADGMSKYFDEKPGSFRRRVSSIGRKKKQQDVAMIAEEVFLQWKTWKISCDVFCSIFYELFDKEDTLPTFIQFEDQFDVILSSFSLLQVIWLNHFFDCMLRTDSGIDGPDSLSNVCFSICRTDIVESDEFCRLFCSLSRVKDLQFDKCLFKGESIDMLCKSLLTSHQHFSLSCLSLRYCNLNESQLSCLSKCAPCLKRFSLVGELISLKASQCLVKEIFDSRSHGCCVISELELHDCKISSSCFRELERLLPVLSTFKISGCTVD